MRNAGNGMRVALVLVAENAIALATGSSLAVSNAACVLAFAFFVASLSPGSPFGFALTIRDWGDIFRRELFGSDPVERPEYKRAAARSLAVLSAFVLLGLCLGLARHGEGARSLLADLAVLAGLESGFVAGYLVIERRPPVPPR